MTQQPPTNLTDEDLDALNHIIGAGFGEASIASVSRFAALHFPDSDTYSNIGKLIAGGFRNSIQSRLSPIWPIDKIYGWADAFFHGDDKGQSLFSARDEACVAHAALARKLAEIGASLPPADRMPVDPANPLRLLSPMEQFNRIEWCDGFYPYGVGDVQNFAARIDMHAEMIDGADVLEVGVGDGIKTGMILDRLAKTSALANAFYLNDNVASNVETAQQRVAHVFHSVADRLVRPDNDGINGVCDDLFAPGEGKLKSTLNTLRESKRPTVVWWNGASINSHNFKRIQTLLEMWTAAFKPGTRFVISVDCTLDVETLAKAYANPFFEQLFVTSFAHPAREMGIDIDLSRLHAAVEISQPETNGVVPVRGKFTSDQVFTLPSGLTHRWPGSQSYVSSISKFPFEKLMEYIDAGGMKLLTETTCADPRYPNLNLKQLVLTQKTCTYG